MNFLYNQEGCLSIGNNLKWFDWTFSDNCLGFLGFGGVLKDQNIEI